MKDMLPKNKGQVLSRNDRRGDQQRIQAPSLGGIRENINKRPRNLAETLKRNVSNPSAPT